MATGQKSFEEYARGLRRTYLLALVNQHLGEEPVAQSVPGARPALNSADGDTSIVE